MTSVAPGVPKPPLASAAALLGDLECRDKLSKFLQYSARALSWYYATRAAASPQDSPAAASLTLASARFRSLYATSRIARKVFRLGKSVNSIHKLSSLVAKPPSALAALDAAREGCLLMYWLFDNFLYAANAKLAPLDERNAAARAGPWYFLSTLAALAATLLRLSALSSERKALLERDDLGASERAEAEAALDERSRALLLLLFKCLCDVGVGSSLAGVELQRRAGAGKANDGVVGTCGAVSAAIAVHTRWGAL